MLSQFLLLRSIPRLNMYAFVRIHSGDARGSYAHPCFIRGKPDICRFMVRTKIKQMEYKTHTVIGNYNEKLDNVFSGQSNKQKRINRRAHSMNEIVPTTMVGAADNKTVSMEACEARNQAFSQLPVSQYLFKCHQTTGSIFQVDAGSVDKDMRLPASNGTGARISKKEDAIQALSPNLFHHGFKTMTSNNNFCSKPLATLHVGPSASTKSLNVPLGLPREECGSDHVDCKDLFDHRLDDDIESIEDPESCDNLPITSTSTEGLHCRDLLISGKHDMRRVMEPSKMKSSGPISNTGLNGSSQRLGAQNASNAAFLRYIRDLDSFNRLRMERATLLHTSTMPTKVSNQVVSEKHLTPGLFNNEQVKKPSNLLGTGFRNNFIANESMTFISSNASASTKESQTQVYSHQHLSSLLFNYHRTKNSSGSDIQTSYTPHQITMPMSSHIKRACTLTSRDSTLDPQVDNAALTLSRQDLRTMSSNQRGYPETFPTPSVASAPSASNTTLDFLMSRNDRITDWMDADDLDHIFDDESTPPSTAEQLPRNIR